MCDFKNTATDPIALDARKRVRYETGLVLGVQEFRQDQFHLRERDRLHQRSLHGYGTVLGLEVSQRPTADGGGPEILVGAGLAIDPRGESICVPQAQCARLDDWLAANQEALDEEFASPPGALSLYVVLCHRECATDPVPVLGDPCRDTADGTRPSRIADDFELALAFAPPEQPEEEASRAFGELLRAFEIRDGAEPALDRAEVEDQVRGLLAGSPPVVQNPASPGLGGRLDPVEAPALLAAAYRVWITEIRPQLAAGRAGCAGSDERCVLLARLDFDLDAGGSQVDGDVLIDEQDRPLLLPTRLFQELLPAGGGDAAGGGGGGGGDHGALAGLEGDDHPQYLLVDAVSRALVADLDAGGRNIGNLAAGTAAGEAVTFDQAVKVGDSAGGDLGDTYPNPTVRALQGSPVAPVNPTQAGQVLTWDGTRWEPRAAPTGNAALEDDLTRIVALSWVHGGRQGLALTHARRARLGIALAFGSESIGDARSEVLAATLNPQTVQLFIHSVTEGSGDFESCLRVPAQVVPAHVANQRDGVITATRRATGNRATAVAVLLSQEVATFLGTSRSQLEIVVRGDFVTDPEGRAINARHLAASLPTGHRNGGGGRLGLPGGRFESWFQVLGIDPVEEIFPFINRASADELTTLPRIGPVLAERIVAERERRGGFTALDDLTDITGISPAILADLRRLPHPEGPSS